VKGRFWVIIILKKRTRHEIAKKAVSGHGVFCCYKRSRVKRMIYLKHKGEDVKRRNDKGKFLQI
jgi:hypothetical protein